MNMDFIANQLCALDVVRIVIILHGVLLAAGGIMGFVKAQSKPSLIAGVASAVLLFTCLGVSFIAPTAAEFAAFAISDTLMLVFAMRLNKTKKFMPSGMMLLICLLAGTYYLIAAVTPWIISKNSNPQSMESQSHAAAREIRAISLLSSWSEETLS